MDSVHNTGCSSDERETEFPFKAFMDDLHVEQPEKAAPEPKAECDRGFRLKIERGIVEA